MDRTNNESTIGVVIVGGGSIAPFHAQYIQSSPDCELLAIVDPFPSGAALAQRLNVSYAKTLADLAVACAITNTKKPQIYYVCTPSGLHARLANEILDQNPSPPSKVILIEKPLSISSASIVPFLTWAHSRGCTVATGHHRRFHPAIVSAKRAIDQGRLGSITAISGVWMCKKNDGYFDVAWRKSRASGGGPVWTNFVHDIDLLHYLVNEPVVKVWAISTRARRRQHRSIPPPAVAEDGTDCSDDNDDDSEQSAVEEGASIMLQFKRTCRRGHYHRDGGVVGTFLLSDNVVSPYFWEAASGENPLVPQTSTPINVLRIFGTHGTLTVPDGHLWTYSPPGRAATTNDNDGTDPHKDEHDLENDTEQQQHIPKVEVGWNMPLTSETLRLETKDDVKPPFQKQLENLVEVVRGQVDEPLCTGTDGLAAVRVCEAVLEALDKADGFPVDILGNWIEKR